MNFHYCSFGDYMPVANRGTNEFDIIYKNKPVAKELFFTCGGVKCEFTEFENIMSLDRNKLKTICSAGDTACDILFEVSDKGVKISSDAPLFMKGKTDFGRDCRAMSTEKHDYIRCAYGPACTGTDNMIFDVQNDFGIVIDGNHGKKFLFNYESGLYEIGMPLHGCSAISVRENVYAKAYNIDYVPINKNTTFKTPPVGWMTWYAVKFDASEKIVLENARWLSENLKKYGAETIWVDWEWYHKDLTGVRDDDCDTFHPDKEKYPRGLKYVSDEIRKCGLIPSLWIGFTNDPNENDFIKNNPDAALIEKAGWCGRYFLDFSHPKYLGEFLPKALKQVDEWGFEAVKFDTLPISIEMHEKYHASMHDPSLSTKQAYRAMVKKSREILGKNRYVMSCAGINDSDVLWACDMFDGARVGNDIFEWHDFIEEGIKKVERYYPMHNVVFFNDADNVIVREEFNNFEQAKSRAAFVGMLGLPVTFGDNLPDLPDERVELLRRCIPVLDIHPSDICRNDFKDIVITNLSVSCEYEDYNVISVLNTSETEREISLALSDIGAETTDPIVYEFYSASIVTASGDTVNIALKPFETKIFSVRENTGRPQIISTSRHISQGASEIERLLWDDTENLLKFSARTVENDLYTVSLNIPQNYRIVRHSGFDISSADDNVVLLSVKSETSKLADFEIEFEKTVTSK